MDHSKKAAGAAAVLLVCAFAVSSASAGEPDRRVRKEDIMFQDLNLSTSAGVDALYRRIHAAAQRVCAVSRQDELGAASATAKCAKGAETRVIEEINLPALTAVANR
ncbi:MAG TPA: UrcA family protein [Steroidobacteraceae bacterium]|nr:UrcA family protein [Steroidobacteraceae bacterium]